MSIRALKLVIERFPDGGSELLCMLLLADWCADDGSSLYPSIALLAAKMRVSGSQARRVLHRLIDKNYVEVVGNRLGGAPGTTRQYHLNVLKLRELPLLEAIAHHITRSVGNHKRQRFDSTELPETGEPDFGSDIASMRAVARFAMNDGSQHDQARLAPTLETACMSASQTVMSHQRHVNTSFVEEAKVNLPQKKPRALIVTVDQLVAEGADRGHALDWLAVRDAKSTPLTFSAWEGNKREATNAKLTIAEVIQIVAERGWLNFRAEYVKGDKRSVHQINCSQKFDPVAFVNRTGSKFNDQIDFVDV